MTDRHVEYVPLAKVQAAPRNPKQHAETQIRASIDRFGLGELPLIDERTGRLVAGHGRIDQLAAMQAAGQAPPDGIRAEGGDWLVPVVRGWASRSDAEAEAYLVASNKLTTNGGWDDAELAAMLADLDDDLLALTGFTGDELAGLLSGGAAEVPAGLTDPDDAPAVPTKAVSVLGDLWQLGRHRLLCGDSTDVVAVEAMLAGDRADVMWTDPPYGVEIVGGSHALSPAERKARGGMSISNDKTGDLPELLAGAFATATAALRPGAPVYVCHPQGPLALEFFDAFRAAGWSLRQNLVWVKDSLVLSRSDYHYRHEPVIYGFTAGGEGRLGRGGPRWYGDDAQTSIFEVARPKRSDLHPTMKPVDLVAVMLANSCPPGGLVYEPFGGSGSTLMAAHRLGARAAVVELDPKYVDVICRRYQEHTGDKPVLAATGEPHDFAAPAGG